MAKKKPRKLQFKSEKNLSKWLHYRQIRDEHLRLRLARCGELYFGWLRPDEIIALSSYDVSVDASVRLRARADIRQGNASLRPVYFTYGDSWMELEHIPRVETIPPEVMNYYDGIKDWWHGFSSPGAHLWGKDVRQIAQELYGYAA